VTPSITQCDIFSHTINGKETKKKNNKLELVKKAVYDTTLLSRFVVPTIFL